MKNLYLLALLCFLSLSQCSQSEEKANPSKPNVLLICVDDLRPELKCYGVEHMISPNIDQLAAKGMTFLQHYVNAPSCGPSRYALLTGQYGPRNNQALFKRAQQIQAGAAIMPSMPEWFRQNGYTTVSVGKVSHHPGGRGGADWNLDSIPEMPRAWDQHLMPVGDWQHPRGMMHGLANGEIRVVPKEMDVMQSTPGPDNIYPDGLIRENAIEQVKTLSQDSKNPFFLAVGIIRPHLPFGAPKKYLDPYQEVDFSRPNYPPKPEAQSTWHPSGEFRQYNLWDKDPNQDEAFAAELRRHYAACVSYADAQVGAILDALQESGAADNTIIVLWGDHGWHLGEFDIWGKHSLFEESLHSPLIIHYPGMQTSGIKSKAITETVDIFPTLCDLAGLPAPTFTHGESLLPFLEHPETNTDLTAFAYWKQAATLRTNTHRLILHEDGYVELYDHSSQEKETRNIADEQATIIPKLKAQLLNKKGQQDTVLKILSSVEEQ